MTVILAQNCEHLYHFLSFNFTGFHHTVIEKKPNPHPSTQPKQHPPPHLPGQFESKCKAELGFDNIFLFLASLA